ncbi:MAG: hypothetical protein KDA17_06670, partial [Candidatus Saccharibacteria bacterium]|nr:hypothetical protein [Candidatus Saccharibacteria bacterium]
TIILKPDHPPDSPHRMLRKDCHGCAYAAGLGSHASAGWSRYAATGGASLAAKPLEPPTPMAARFFLSNSLQLKFVF